MGGESWERPRAVNDGREFGAIQPTLLSYPGDRIQALCRSRQGVVTQTWSSNVGRSWGAMKATALPNPNAGIDEVTLSDGRQLLAYNHTPKGRSPPAQRG